MPQTINTNITSLNAQRNLNNSQGMLNVAMQRLSSGMRVNSAKDDAAGLAIAERMNTQVRGMNVAIRNANDGISLSQTAEGALGKVGDMLQRMRELAVQSANSTNNSSDRDALNNEFSQIQIEIGRLARNTTFNGTQLLTGTGGAAFAFQVGANATTDDQISIPTFDIMGTTLGDVASGTQNNGALAAVCDTAQTDIRSGGTPVAAPVPPDFVSYTTTGPSALDALAKIDYALAQVNLARSTFGATQNRFESVIANLQVSVENQSAARSRIMDADYAQETAALSRAQILQQAGNAMVAQANQLPQQVLALLQGR